MIDATKITKYNQTTQELQESLLFWVLAAGKNGKRAANIVNKIVVLLNKYFPNKNLFEQLKNYDQEELASMFLFYGTGCQNIKAKTINELIYSNLDLKKCTINDLERIYGIGKKTARCFIIHSRENIEYAGLDTHILKFLKIMGIKKVPKNTPNSKKEYLRLEKEFLNIAKKYNKSTAQFDLELWNEFSVGGI